MTTKREYTTEQVAALFNTNVSNVRALRKRYADFGFPKPERRMLYDGAVPQMYFDADEIDVLVKKYHTARRDGAPVSATMRRALGLAEPARHQQKPKPSRRVQPGVSPERMAEVRASRLQDRLATMEKQLAEILELLRPLAGK
jgi:hypothetical protein